MQNNSPPGDKTNKPQNRKDENREQEQFGVMQEREGVIPQKRDIGVIDQGGEVESVPEERREEVTRGAGEEGEEKELDDVEVEVKREECAVGDLVD